MGCSCDRPFNKLDGKISLGKIYLLTIPLEKPQQVGTMLQYPSFSYSIIEECIVITFIGLEQSVINSY